MQRATFLRHYAPNGVQGRAPGRPALVRVALQEVDQRVPHRLRLPVRPCRAVPTVTAASACRAPVPPQGPRQCERTRPWIHTPGGLSATSVGTGELQGHTATGGRPPHARTRTRRGDRGMCPSTPSSEAGRLPSLWAPGGSWGGITDKNSSGCPCDVCTSQTFLFSRKVYLSKFHHICQGRQSTEERILAETRTV